MKIKFCGAAAGVTGSCHLITVGGDRSDVADERTDGGRNRAAAEGAARGGNKAETDTSVRILLDCGQFQGGNSLEAQNYDPFPFRPDEIDLLILSHAHIDHCGRIPLLVKRGFSGPVYCTDATADLLGVMLRDSAYIHEKEAEWKTRKAQRAGRPPAEPLYTVKDAEAALKHVVPVLYNQLVEPLPGVKFVLNDAGHIIGSAIVELWTTEGGNVSKLVFSGDLGTADRPMLRDPVVIKKADCVIMESTYGNRLHEDNEESIRKLADILIRTAKIGGTVVIPSFAVGRTQELIYELNNFFEGNEPYRKELEQVIVYIDSPMATAATEVFRRNAQVFDEEFKQKILAGDDPLDFVNLRFTKTTAESMSLNEGNESKVIISASGMCEAGRIRHHLKHHLWDARAAVVFVGYQGEGTLGRRLLDGAETVTLFGEEVFVNARIYNLEGFSAHADQNGLLAWAKGFRAPPAAFFLVHGELQAKRDLAREIETSTGIRPIVTEGVSEYELGKHAVTTEAQAMRDIVAAEDVGKLRKRITDMRASLEDILYNSSLALSEAGDPTVVTDINNRLMALEKEMFALASAVKRQA
ncbi:MAG: MBL fold metallo-hydrolase [Clostridiales Family XIII bacterium]|jgi:metallo-beta-lactamase family protein|nr:MBL fold metallo-hydrolase [Clostridiales Family XIII bacterium]